MTAADIVADADVEVLNPDAHIALLMKGAELNMTMVIETGRGYTSSEKNKKHINVLQKHLRLGNNVFRSYIIFSELSKYAHADAAPNQGRIDAIKLKN